MKQTRLKSRFLFAFTFGFLYFPPSLANENNVNEQAECLKEAKSGESLSNCLEEIFTILEGKRLILESAAKHKSFDPNSTIDWGTFYAKTLEDSRQFFEKHRKSECERKEILSSTGSKSRYEKLICQIRMTKDRINSLQ